MPSMTSENAELLSNNEVMSSCPLGSSRDPELGHRSSMC